MRLLKDYLTGRYERVVLSGQTSLWLNVTVGVSQGSALGRLLFLIHINDLTNEITSSCKKFADDTRSFRK